MSKAVPLDPPPPTAKAVRSHRRVLETELDVLKAPAGRSYEFLPDVQLVACCVKDAGGLRRVAIWEYPEAISVAVEQVLFLQGMTARPADKRHTPRNYAASRKPPAATERWKAERMRDPEWVKRYLAGEGEPKEKMMLADIILSGGIRA